MLLFPSGSFKSSDIEIVTASCSRQLLLNWQFGLSIVVFNDNLSKVLLNWEACNLSCVIFGLLWRQQFISRLSIGFLKGEVLIYMNIWYWRIAWKLVLPFWIRPSQSEEWWAWQRKSYNWTESQVYGTCTKNQNSSLHSLDWNKSTC